MILNGVKIESIEQLEEVIADMSDEIKVFLRSLYKPTN
jgi:hypothetical protein